MIWSLARFHQLNPRPSLIGGLLISAAITICGWTWTQNAATIRYYPCWPHPQYGTRGRSNASNKSWICLRHLEKSAKPCQTISKWWSNKTSPSKQPNKCCCTCKNHDIYAGLEMCTVFQSMASGPGCKSLMMNRQDFLGPLQMGPKTAHEVNQLIVPIVTISVRFFIGWKFLLKHLSKQKNVGTCWPKAIWTTTLWVPKPPKSIKTCQGAHSVIAISISSDHWGSTGPELLAECSQDAISINQLFSTSHGKQRLPGD